MQSIEIEMQLEDESSPGVGSEVLKKIKTGLPWGIWLLLLGLALMWRLQNIDAFGITNDEGAHLMWARLVSHGYPLYTQTYINHPPLFIEILALTFKVFGFSITLGRVVVLAWFVFLVGIVAYLAYQIVGWFGAYASLVITAFITPLFILSRQVMLEIPALALAVAAVGCGYLFFRQKPVYGLKPAGWLALGGVFLGFSFLVKYLHPLAVAPILYFIWHGSPSYRQKFKHVLWFGLAFVGTCLLIVSFYDVAAFFDQTVFFRAGTRETGSLPVAENWTRLVAYGGRLWGLSLLALLGLGVALRQAEHKRGQAWGLWLLANVALVLWYRPLFPHHFTILLPAAILLAVEFLAFCRATQKLHWGWLVVAVACFNLFALTGANQSATAATTGGREAEAAKILSEVTRPDDFVMSDSQLLALFSDRLTPPPLLDFSLVTIKSGRQSAARLIDLSTEYSVAAVAPWALRMIWLPDYLDWVEERYWVHKVWDNNHQLYFGPKHPPGQPVPNAQTVHLEQGIIFSGYRIDRDDIQAGHDLPLTLYWQTDQALEIDYTIFVQVLDITGRLVAQYDSQPIYGYFPTSRWPVEQIIPDRAAIALPEDLAPGSYTVIAGMYELSTLARLNLSGTGEDNITVTSFTIE